MGVFRHKNVFVFGGSLHQRRGSGLGVTVFPRYLESFSPGVPLLTYFLISSGGYYIGEFANGELEGEGSLYYKEGDEYSGGWTRNVKNGFGIYKWVSVRRLKGRCVCLFSDLTTGKCVHGTMER